MMRTNTKPRVYISRLPSTPVTPEMRDQVVEAAKERGVSICDLNRTALSLFLQQNYTHTIDKDTKSIDNSRGPGAA